MSEPLYISLTALVEGYGYTISFGIHDADDIDGIGPDLKTALNGVLTEVNKKNISPTEATPPTCEELWESPRYGNGDIKSVHRETDDSYRHGVSVYHTFHRKSDDTYWTASYNKSNDGEENELRQGTASIMRVYQKLNVITEYESVAGQK